MRDELASSNKSTVNCQNRFDAELKIFKLRSTADIWRSRINKVSVDVTKIAL